MSLSDPIGDKSGAKSSVVLGCNSTNHCCVIHKETHHFINRGLSSQEFSGNDESCHMPCCLGLFSGKDLFCGVCGSMQGNEVAGSAAF